MKHALVVYEKLETRIKKGDLDALLARWESGRKLAEEREETGRLPHGRMEQLVNALTTSATELKNRMLFAEQYPSKEKVRAAFEVYGSWFAICDRGLGRRGAEATIPATDAELDLARSRRELEEWGVLEPNALDGLSDLEARTVITELRTAYDHYVEDPARGKVAAWSDEVSADELRRALGWVQGEGGKWHKKGRPDPSTWMRDGGWYPPFTIPPSTLRLRAQKIIADLKVGKGDGYEMVRRRLDLAGQLGAGDTGGPAGDGSTSVILRALLTIVDAAQAYADNRRYLFPDGAWKLDVMLPPDSFAVRVEEHPTGPRLIVEGRDD